MESPTGDRFACLSFTAVLLFDCQRDDNPSLNMTQPSAHTISCPFCPSSSLEVMGPMKAMKARFMRSFAVDLAVELP